MGGGGRGGGGVVCGVSAYSAYCLHCMIVPSSSRVVRRWVNGATADALGDFSFFLMNMISKFA